MSHRKRKDIFSNLDDFQKYASSVNWNLTKIDQLNNAILQIQLELTQLQNHYRHHKHHIITGETEIDL